MTQKVMMTPSKVIEVVGWIAMGNLMFVRNVNLEVHLQDILPLVQVKLSHKQMKTKKGSQQNYQVQIK